MNDNKLLSVARETLERYLKAHGMRCTPERFALLERVFATGDHFFVDVLCEALELEGYHVSRSTAYATMQLFIDAGLVKRHQFGNQPAQYERIIPGSSRNHIHLVCTMCGKVREVSDSMLSSALCSRKYAGFRPATSALYVYGLCGRCQRIHDKKH